MDDDNQQRRDHPPPSTVPQTDQSQSLSPQPGPSGISFPSLLSPPLSSANTLVLTSTQTATTSILSVPSIGGPPSNSQAGSSQMSSRLSDPRLALSTLLGTLGGGALSRNAQTERSSDNTQRPGSALNNRAGSVSGGASGAEFGVVPGGVRDGVSSARQSVSGRGLFQIPLSQDLFVTGGSRDLSLGFGSSQSDMSSQSLPPGPPPSNLNYNLTSPSVQELIDQEERKQQEEEKARKYDLLKMLRTSEQREGFQLQQGASTSSGAGGLSRYEQESRQEAVRQLSRRLRENVPRVPGTESSQSSDDSTSSVHGVARKEQTISVPESTLTTHQIRSDTVLGDQVAIITASSESDFSASEFHVPRSESDRERSPNIKLQEDKFLKRGKKVPQKVPSFSSRRMLDLKEQEKQDQRMKSLEAQFRPIQKSPAIVGSTNNRHGSRGHSESNGGSFQPVQPVTEGHSDSTHNGPQSSQNVGNKERSPNDKHSSSEDSQHSGTNTSLSLKIGPPSWGADTDASTEYPASQTTASGSGSGESTLACESSVTRTVLTSADQRRSLEVISQPISQTLPIISSTPFDMDTAIQPTGFRDQNLFVTPAKKQTSDETTTSSTTATSSGSGGHVEKLKHVMRANISLETICGSLSSAGGSVPLQDQNLNESPGYPLARLTPSLHECPTENTKDNQPLITVQSTLPSEIETQPIHYESQLEGVAINSPDGVGAVSQDLFHNTSVLQESQEDLANERPAWCSAILTGESQNLESSQTKQPEEQQSSSSSEQSSVAPTPPPRKRRRANDVQSSSSPDIPRWQREESQDQPSVRSIRSSISTSLKTSILPVSKRKEESKQSSESPTKLTSSSSSTGTSNKSSSQTSASKSRDTSYTDSQGLSGTTSSSFPKSSSSSSSAPSSVDISSSFPSSGSANQSRTTSSHDQSRGHSSSSNEPADPSSSFTSSGGTSKSEVCEVRTSVTLGSHCQSLSQSHSTPSQTTHSQSTQDSFLKMPKGLEVSPAREGGDETSLGCSSSSSGQSSLGTISGSADVQRSPSIAGQIPQSTRGKRSLEVIVREDEETQYSNPPTRNMQTPVFIDLTFQSQTDHNEPSAIAEKEIINPDYRPPGSPDILLSTSDSEKSMEMNDDQTPDLSVELPSISVILPIVSTVITENVDIPIPTSSTVKNLNPCADISQEDMEIDTATQSSFRLQLSPSQSFLTQRGETDSSEGEAHLNQDPVTFIREIANDTLSMESERVGKSLSDEHAPTTDLKSKYPRDSDRTHSKNSKEDQNLPEIVGQKSGQDPTGNDQKEICDADNSSSTSPSSPKTEQSDQSLTSTSSQSGKTSSGSNSTSPEGGMGGPKGGDSKEVVDTDTEMREDDSSSRDTQHDNNIQSEHGDPSVNPTTASVFTDRTKLEMVGTVTRSDVSSEDKEKPTNETDCRAVSSSAIQSVTSTKLSFLHSHSTNIHTSSSVTKKPVPVYESLRLDDSSESLLDLSKYGSQSRTVQPDPLPQCSTAKMPEAMETNVLVADSKSNSDVGGVHLSQEIEQPHPQLDTLKSVSSNKPTGIKTVVVVSNSLVTSKEPKPDSSLSEPVPNYNTSSDKHTSQNTCSPDITSTVTHASSKVNLLRSPMSIMSVTHLDNVSSDGTAVSESITDSVFALQFDQATSESLVQSEKTDTSALHKEPVVTRTPETQSSKSNCEQNVSEGNDDSHLKQTEIRQESPIQYVADSMKNQQYSAGSLSLFSESSKDVALSTGDQSVSEKPINNKSQGSNPSIPSLRTKSTPPLKSPRKSLSLRARRTPTNTDKGKRKLLLTVGTDKNKGQPEKQQSRSESATNSGFVLGMHSQPDSQFSQDDNLDSQFPLIQLPSNSQFESSESSDVPFCIVRPKTDSETSTDNVPTTTVTSRGSNDTSVDMTSLFSSVRASSFSRLSDKQSRGDIPTGDIAVESIFSRKKDPYEFDSQSQDSDVHFVRPRAQRNKPTILHDSVGTSTHPVPSNDDSKNTAEGTRLSPEKTPVTDSQGEDTVAGNVQTSKETEVYQDTSQKSLHKKFSISNTNLTAFCTNSVSTTGPAPKSKYLSCDTSMGGIESQSSVVDTESEAEREGGHQMGIPTSQEDFTSQRSSGQTLQQDSEFHPQVPQVSCSVNTNLITPSNSQTFPPASQSLAVRSHPSFISPLPSTPISVEFVSPSTMISPSGLEELKRQVGKEGASRFELRHVKTVRTVIEQRIVSSEVIVNNRVVQGSSQVWPETCEPRVLQEVKVELAPHQASTPPPFQNFSFSSATPHLIPTTLIQNVGPSMNIIHSPSSAIVESTSRSPDRQEDKLDSDPVGDRFESLSTTPNVPRQGGSRLPMRLVHPFPQTGNGAGNSNNDEHVYRQLLSSNGQLTRSIRNRNSASGIRSTNLNLSLVIENDDTNTNQARSQRHPVQQAREPTPDPFCDSQTISQEIDEQDFGEAPLPSDASNNGSTHPKAQKDVRNLTQRKPDSVGLKSKGATAFPRRLSLRRSPRKSGGVTKTLSDAIGTETRRSLFEVDKQQPSREALTESHDDVTPAAEHVVTVSKVTENIEMDSVRLDTTRCRKRLREDSPKNRSVSSKQKKTKCSSTQLGVQVSTMGTAKTCKDTPTGSESETMPIKAPRGQRDSVGKKKELPNRKKLKLTTQSSEPGSSVGTQIPATLGVGSKVIARWKDKCWYVATITSVGKHGRFSVKYADGDHGSVTSTNLFHIENLKAHVPVMAIPISNTGSQSSDILQPGSKMNGLFGQFVDGAYETFTFEVGNKTHTYSAGCLSVPSETALSCLHGSNPAVKAGLTRKRSRGSVSSGKDDELSDLPVPKKKRTSHSAASSPQQASTSVIVSDCVPREQLSMLRGYVFTLTQRPKDETKSDVAASPQIEAVNKEQIASQIKNRGGRVLETFKSQQIVDGRYFVLSDTYCRTKKYLLGLAFSVPCVSYDWINKCINQGKVLDYSRYQLPAGTVGDDSVPVLWTSRERSAVLRDYNVLLIGDSRFKNHWTPILQAAGAKVIPKLPTTNNMARSHNSSDIIIVVCEHTGLLSDSLRHRESTSLGTIRILRTDWIVTCLIQGQKLMYDDFDVVK